MNKSASNVTLLIPGLLEPFSDLDPGLFSDLPALAKLLARGTGKATSNDNFETVACRLFNISPDENSELPIAQMTWLSDFGSRSGSALLRADPVHLRPDKTELRLFPADQLALTETETEHLIGSLNEQYRSDGLEFVVSASSCWYVRIDRQAALTTHPLTDVAGKDIRHYLPRGADSGYWKTLFNEIQMLLHAHAVNQRRREQQQVAINSLWFWGGASLPEHVSPVDYCVIGQDSLTAGLARFSGLKFEKARSDYSAISPLVETHNNSLVVNTELLADVACGDIEGWRQKLLQLEQVLFIPLLSALKKGRLTSVRLLPCNGRLYQINRIQLLKFWKSFQGFRSW